MANTKKAANTHRAPGGVSSKPRSPSTQDVEMLGKPREAAFAGAHPDFIYHGGPVIASPQVYISFWGSLWVDDAAHLARTKRLSQFHADLLQSNFMNVLSQYGVGSGAGMAGLFIQATFLNNIPSTLTDTGNPTTSIQSIIQSAIDAGALPEPTNPSNNALFIYLDENTGVDDPNIVLCEPRGDTAFGYHEFFFTNAGNPFYYSVIPALNDTCLTDTCADDDVHCTVHLSQTQEQRQTLVAAHEFAEMTTDPQVNAWFEHDTAGENGDLCAGKYDIITSGGNSWTVQRIYSKYDDMNSDGGNFCLAQVPNPEPILSPGPILSSTDMAWGRRMASYEGLFPLPAKYFDAGTKTVSMDEEGLHRYAHNMFYPLRHEHIVANFPAFLRQVAHNLERQ